MAYYVVIYSSVRLVLSELQNVPFFVAFLSDRASRFQSRKQSFPSRRTRRYALFFRVLDRRISRVFSLITCQNASYSAFLTPRSFSRLTRQYFSFNLRCPIVGNFLCFLRFCRRSPVITTGVYGHSFRPPPNTVLLSSRTPYFPRDRRLLSH